MASGSGWISMLESIFPPDQAITFRWGGVTSIIPHFLSMFRVPKWYREK